MMRNEIRLTDPLPDRLEYYARATTTVHGGSTHEPVALCIAAADDLKEAARLLRNAEVPRADA
jgi:hypothetical protein